MSNYKRITDTEIRNTLTPVKVNLTKEADSKFFDVPTSAATNLMLNVLGAGTKVEQLTERHAKINHASSIAVVTNAKNESNKKVVLSKGEQTITLTVNDLNKLTGSNKTAKKLFIYTLAKMAHNALSNGELYTNYIEFPVKELVDSAIYANLPAARRAFTEGMEVLTSIKVGGEVKNGKEVSSSELAVLFPYAGIKDGKCHIDLNERINWSFIAMYYTKLPAYIFTLPVKSFDLLYYIFYLARQNTLKLKEAGFFTISFRAIQNYLQLPSEVGIKNALRDIKDPIEQAIEQIEDAHRGNFNNMDFQLLPVMNDNLPIKDWLDTGYLKVTMLGDFAEPFIELADTQKKQIDRAYKKKENMQKLIDNKIAENIAKSATQPSA